MYSAAPDSAAVGPAGGGEAGAPRLPFGPRQQAELRGTLEGALLGCPRPLEALGGRLPAELVAALEARQQGLRQGHVSRGIFANQGARMVAMDHGMPVAAVPEENGRESSTNLAVCKLTHGHNGDTRSTSLSSSPRHKPLCLTLQPSPAAQRQRC